MTAKQTAEQRIEEIAAEYVSNGRIHVIDDEEIVRQAIRAALADPILQADIIERCAKVADDYVKNGNNMYARHSGRAVATRIRALKTANAAD